MDFVLDKLPGEFIEILNKFDEIYNKDQNTEKWEICIHILIFLKPITNIITNKN